MYIGGAFGYSEAGFEYNVTFDCKEKKESQTGIGLADISNIQVTDRTGTNANHEVSMDRVEHLCHEKAIAGVSGKERPNVSDN